MLRLWSWDPLIKFLFAGLLWLLLGLQHYRSHWGTNIQEDGSADILEWTEPGGLFQVLRYLRLQRRLDGQRLWLRGPQRPGVDQHLPIHLNGEYGSGASSPQPGCLSLTPAPCFLQQDTQPCYYDSKRAVAHIRDYRFLSKGDEQALADAVATIGPITVAIDASHSSFLFYSSGQLQWNKKKKIQQVTDVLFTLSRRPKPSSKTPNCP